MFQSVILILLVITYKLEYTFGKNLTEINGYKNYTSVSLGNINILLTAPHGGYLEPNDIASRTSDALGNLVGDYNTKALSFLIKEHLQQLFKEKQNLYVTPFLVYSDLTRKKMDPNRNSKEACDNQNDDCMRAYTDFHNHIVNHFVTDFMMNNNKKFRQGLVLDIHGQSHAIGWIELGYMLTAEDLEANTLNSEKYLIKSSLRNLALSKKYSLEELLRGSKSLGSIFQSTYKLDTVPSPTNKSPNGEKYYSGGYITETYSRLNKMNAIQLELPFKLRSDSSYKNSSKIIANAIYEFYMQNGLNERLEDSKATLISSAKSNFGYQGGILLVSIFASSLL